MKPGLFFAFFFYGFFTSAQQSFKWADTVFAKGASRMITAGCVRFPGERGSCLDRNPDETSLDTLALFLKKNSSLCVLVEMHSDTRGTAAMNLKLTKEWGLCTKKYLTEVYAINPNSIQIKGMGEEYPLFTEEAIKKVKTKEEKERLRQQNRRSILRIVSVGGK